MRRIFFLFYFYLELQPPPGGRTLDSTYLSYLSIFSLYLGLQPPRGGRTLDSTYLSTSLYFRSLSFFMVVINYNLL